MLIDIHAKSSISRDDNPSPRTVLERARDAQLDGVAFCEHQSTVYSERILQAADDLGVEAFVGVEIPTDTGLLLGFAPEIDEFYHGEYWRRLTEVTVPSPQAIVDMFRERGGAVVAARPYDRSVAHPMGDNVFEIDGLDAVEAANSRVEQKKDDFAVEAATYLGKPTVGGSDPEASTDAIGRYGTFFDGTFSTQSELVDALRDGSYWAVEIG